MEVLHLCSLVHRIEGFFSTGRKQLSTYHLPENIKLGDKIDFFIPCISQFDFLKCNIKFTNINKRYEFNNKIQALIVISL